MAVATLVAPVAAQPRERFDANLVVMLRAQNTEGEMVCAAGILLSQTSNRTLILTAAHFLADAGTVKGPGKQLTAEFAWLRGKYVDAVPLKGVFDEKADYAVLSVEAAPRVPDPKLFIAIGRLPARGKLPLVTEVGNPGCKAWEHAVTPQRMVSKSTTALTTESRFAMAGSSGGALFTEEGKLIGMIISADGRFAQARPIALILEDLRRYRLEVALTTGASDADDDEDGGLAAFEATMADGSIGERQRALNQALVGHDPALKATALRYAVCAKRSLAYSTATTPPSADHQMRYVQHVFGTVNIPISGCDVRTGTFDITGVHIQHREGGAGFTPAGGQISGSRITLRFASGGFIGVQCSGDFKLQDAETLAGQLTCSWGRNGWTSAATIPIF